MGVIARDSEGKVLASLCSVQRYKLDPAIAEAYGARQAAEFGRFLGLQSVILEGDDLKIIVELGKNDDGAGKYSNFIVEGRRLLMGFMSWDVRHVRREGNKVAHTLAKFVVSHQQNQFWFESYSTCLLGLVNSELILSDF